MAKLGWIGSLTALIVPAAANAFGIFWMRQYMTGAIHDELMDASASTAAASSASTGMWRCPWSALAWRSSASSPS